MNMESNFLIGQISDLHFSDKSDAQNPNLKHSPDLLLALEDALKPHKSDMDRLIVSGDLSNYGDKESLNLAHGFLFQTIPIGAGKHVGLGFEQGKVGIVAGNHDAWNSPRASKWIDRRQKSVENFNYAFPEHRVPEEGCYYDWLERDGVGILLAYVDSCYLGDHAENVGDLASQNYVDAIARGKFSIRQSQILLELHDLGMKGKLPDLKKPGTLIPANTFARALRILVMHHYLFEPPEFPQDRYLKMEHRDLVFRNIALSDFDVLLCGHKHVPAFSTHTYGDHFDHRALHRLVLNCYRRRLGLHSLPEQFTDGRGREVSRPLSFVINLLCKMLSRRKEHKQPIGYVDELVNILKNGLANPRSMEKRLKEYLKDYDFNGVSVLDEREIEEIRIRLTTQFTQPERDALRPICTEMLKEARRLKGRPFLQVMCGASAKSSDSQKSRCYNLFRISFQNGEWLFRSERFTWDWGLQAFSAPLIEQLTFARP